MAKVDDTLNTYYPLFDDGLYTEVVHENGERAIKILKGEFTDVIFQYGKVELIPKEKSEIPTINFNRAVRACPEKLLDTISTDENFNKLMGDILIELLANEGIKELNHGVQHKVSKQT